MKNERSRRRKKRMPLKYRFRRLKEKLRQNIKEFSLFNIITRWFVFFMIAGVAFMCQYLKDNNNLGTGPVRNYFADIFSLFQYPLLYLLAKFSLKYNIDIYNWATYLISILIDTYLFALFIEIIYFFLYRIVKPTESGIFKRWGLALVIIGFACLIISETVHFKTIYIEEKIGFVYTYYKDGYSRTKGVFMYSAFGLMVLGSLLIAFNPARHLKDLRPGK